MELTLKGILDALKLGGVVLILTSFCMISSSLLLTFLLGKTAASDVGIEMRLLLAICTAVAIFEMLARRT